MEQKQNQEPKKRVSITANKPNLFDAIWVSFQATFWTIVYLVENAFIYISTYPKHCMVFLMVLFIFAATIVTGKDISSKFAIYQNDDSVYNEIIKISRLSRHFESNSGKTFLFPGGPDWIKKESIKAILHHAKQNGLSAEDKAIILVVADVESGLNPLSHSTTTSACGLFQFTAGTRKQYDINNKNCTDPWSNAQAGVKHYLNNYNIFKPQLKGLKKDEKFIKLFELSYFIHHDGFISKNNTEIARNIISDNQEFLLKVRDILKNDERSKITTDTFLSEVADNITSALK